MKQIFLLILFLTSTTAFSQNKNIKMRLDSIVIDEGRHKYKTSFFYKEHENKIQYACLSLYMYYFDMVFEERHIYEYFYDSNENISTIVLCDFNDYVKANKLGRITKWEYTYDSNGNRTSSAKYLWNDTIRTWEECSSYKSMYYDSNQNLIMEVVKNGKKIEYTYNSNGNRTKEVVRYWIERKNAWGNEIDKYKYVCNNGNIEQEEKHEKLKYEYIYDSKENLITEIYYFKGKKTWVKHSKSEYVYDTSYFISIKKIIFPNLYSCPHLVDWYLYRHNNMLLELREYRWYENDWVHDNTTKYYYSPQIIESNNEINTNNE